MNYLLYIVSFLLFSSEFILMLSKRSLQNSTVMKADRLSLPIMWIVIILSITAAFYLSWHGKFGVRELDISMIGLIIVIIGIFIRWIAILQLKNAFTVDVSISIDHKLKTDGLYRLIRHPSYSGMLLNYFGLSIAMNSWYSILVLNIPIMLVLRYRIYIEEKLLVKSFGEEYLNYMKRTKRIIPYIY